MHTISRDLLTLAAGVELRRFEHPYFKANAWLVANDTHALLIDTASNGNDDGEQVARFVAESRRELAAIVVSHGHPDVFFGLKPLRARFPGAKAMKRRYPGHAGAEFQLHMTATNAAWGDA